VTHFKANLELNCSKSALKMSEKKNCFEQGTARKPPLKSPIKSPTSGGVRQCETFREIKNKKDRAIFRYRSHL
jgi:hypothetical protein